MKRWRMGMIGSLIAAITSGCGTSPVAGATSPVVHTDRPVMVTGSSIAQSLTTVSSSASGATWLWGPSAIWYRPGATAAWHSVAPTHAMIEAGWVQGTSGWFTLRSGTDAFRLDRVADGGHRSTMTRAFSGTPIGLSWVTSRQGFLLSTRYIAGTRSTVGSYSATLWETTSAGQSWRPLPITLGALGPTAGEPGALAFTSPTAGWITGGSLACPGMSSVSSQT